MAIFCVIGHILIRPSVVVAIFESLSNIHAIFESLSNIHGHRILQLSRIYMQYSRVSRILHSNIALESLSNIHGHIVVHKTGFLFLQAQTHKLFTHTNTRTPEMKMGFEMSAS